MTSLKEILNLDKARERNSTDLIDRQKIGADCMPKKCHRLSLSHPADERAMLPCLVSSDARTYTYMGFAFFMCRVDLVLASNYVG